MDDITIPGDASPESLKMNCLVLAQQIGMMHELEWQAILSIAMSFHEWVDPAGVERR